MQSPISGRFILTCIMAPIEELFSRKFHRLIVLPKFEMRKGHIYLFCQCDCGNEKWVRKEHIVKEKIKSCGCLRYDCTSNLTHGMYGSPEYKVWAGIKRRCNNPHEKRYKNYGGRGLKICQRWSDSFEQFYTDIGKKSSSQLQIERKNNDIGYTCGQCDECKQHNWPANCYWATRKEQGSNKRTNRFVTYNGRTQTLQQWADELDVNCSALQSRLNKCMNISKVFSTPYRRSSCRLIAIDNVIMPLFKWLKLKGISRTDFYRKSKKGFSPAEIFTKTLNETPV